MRQEDILGIIIIKSLLYARKTIRRGKLNSQFIVADFSILHAGGRSLFRFQTSKRVRETLGLNSRSPRCGPSIAALEGAGPKCHIVAVYNLKYEKI